MVSFSELLVPELQFVPKSIFMNNLLPGVFLCLQAVNYIGEAQDVCIVHSVSTLLSIY